jgi:hypothetical protein
VFKAVARVASNVDVTPYNVDKLFWLIGSGNFYGNPEIGNNGKIGKRKKQFIETAQTMMEQVDHLKENGPIGPDARGVEIRF